MFISVGRTSFFPRIFFMRITPWVDIIISSVSYDKGTCTARTHAGVYPNSISFSLSLSTALPSVSASPVSSALQVPALYYETSLPMLQSPEQKMMQIMRANKPSTSQVFFFPHIHLCHKENATLFSPEAQGGHGLNDEYRLQRAQASRIAHRTQHPEEGGGKI